MKKHFKIYTFLILLFCCISSANAADKFYVNPMLLEAGKNATIDFLLDNDSPYYGFQADVELPVGITMRSMSLDKSRTDSNYDITSNIDNGKILIASFSSDHTPISGSRGTLLSMDVDVSADFKGGVLTISNIIFVSDNNKDIKLPDSSTMIGLYVPVSSISLNQSSAYLKVGETLTLSHTILPENATDKTVTWSSDNSGIATVDANGNVTALALGQTIITVSCGEKSADCIVTVIPTPVESIIISKESVELMVGKSFELSATVLPDDATDKTISWTSDNTDIAVVDAFGKVTAKALGQATIIASSGNKNAYCSVTVIPTPVENIIISKESLEMFVGNSFELIATVLPDDATDKTIAWTSSNENIATVDDSGIVTALSIGEAIITASCGNVKAICKVSVVLSPVEKIILSKEEAELEVGETITIEAEVLPENISGMIVMWSSENTDVATVDANGNVTAQALGATTITATYGNATATCKVTVVPTPVKSISLTNTELIMREGYSTELIAIVRPDNATDKRVTWSSDNENIVTVDANGNVYAKAVGYATVTATSVSDPSIKADCKVTVLDLSGFIAVNDILLSDYELTMNEGENYSLTATILPEYASDKTVTWKSSDRSVATVDENGKVTAIRHGSAIIYASSSNGLTVECNVTVIHVGDVEVSGISLSNTELLMREGFTAELFAIVHPDNASDKSVTWTSTDESVATVDQNGIVTAIKQGTAIIAATTANGLVAYCNVTVVPNVTAVEQIILSETSLEMEIDETHLLIATILPEDATDKTVTWKSSNLSVATVSEDGTVTAISTGTAIIYASSSNGLTAECVVTVVTGEIEVTRLSLSNTELLMREGYTAEIFAIIYPENASDKTVIWTSSDESVATVDQNGNITAIKQGNAIITATTANGLTANCYVTVVPVVIAVEEIILSETSLVMEIDEIHSLTATILPEDATDKTVTWKSLDESVVIVSNDGTVTAVGAGTATIYASTSNSLTAECSVIVNPGEIAVISISLSNTELLMREGYTAELIALVRPDDATDKRVTWSSSDESIATVDQNGIVTAIKQGKAIITATSVYDPTVKADCYVTVEPETKIIAVSEIIISETSLIMEIEETHTLTATVLPDDATDKTITWKSSDKSVATVSEDGVVTAVSAGNAVIYASSSNGLTAECKVTVNPGIIPVTGISLTNTELLMREGYTAELIAIISPDNATDKSVTWTSSDESVATVNQYGTVTAIKQGTTTVTATSSNGIKANCFVTVVPVVIAVEKIIISETSIEMEISDTHILTATILPEDATDKTVTWKTSDRDIAIVSAEGVVTAVSAGSAVIYASSSNGLTAECSVTVNPGDIAVTGISLTNTELLMREGYTADLIAIVHPDNATDKSVVWASSDESIATVDQNGLVSAIKQGIALVSATASNGMNAYCTVTVVPVIIAVADISISKSELTLTEGDFYTLTATVMPEDATDKTVTWKSSDRAVATVAEDGTISALSAGTAVIYASSSNGLTAECALTVIPRTIVVTNITIDASSLTLMEGESATLTATIEPSDATDKSVTWSSNNTDIAKVEDGIVTGLKPGIVTITAKTSNGKNAYCTVTVLERPLTPKQLLRKGDGTSCTFITMMDLSDSELSELGYRFVYGYTDGNGQSHVITESPLRYCHTTSEIYNSPSNDFWVFAVITNEDGKILNSNLRHLDGREEVCFDISKFGFTTKGSSDVATIEMDDLITITPSGIYVAANNSSDLHVALYSMTGSLLYSKSYDGESRERVLVEFNKLTPDAYVLTVVCGGKVISKRIVVR